MTFRKECAEYCIAAIRALMREEAVPPCPQGIGPEELLSFAKFHGVEAMVWHCLERQNMDFSHPVLQSWENRAAMLLVQSMVQLQERDILFTALPAAGISILPVKGCWLKERYPQIDYRQMSDLDMLIHPEDAEKAKEVMLSLGYRLELYDEGTHDSYEKPPYMGVELHRSLLQAEDPHHDYYDDVWEKARPQPDNPSLYRLTTEDEYIYYLLHLRKHVVQAGSGIRSFLDSVVYRRIYRDMDSAYLQREYEKLGITAFAAAIERLADCWFDTGEAVPEQLRAMAENILSAGSYGTETQILENQLDRLQKKYRSPLLAKALHLFRLIFLPLENMVELYPALGKHPVLLPLYWIRRIFSRLLFKRKAVAAVIKNVDEAGDNLWSRFDWQAFLSE